jgi:hypothetical protein
VRAHAQGAEKRGAHKSAEINRWLVSELDAILYANIGRHISRSDKRPELDYVQLCFRVANPKIGSGSIEKAIRFYLGRARAAK